MVNKVPSAGGTPGICLCHVDMLNSVSRIESDSVHNDDNVGIHLYWIVQWQKQRCPLMQKWALYNNISSYKSILVFLPVNNRRIHTRFLPESPIAV